MSVTQEFVTVSMDKFKFYSIVEYFQLNNPIDYVVKKVTIKDNLFDGDIVYKELKRNADSAYKKLEEYQFNKRNNIKSR